MTVVGPDETAALQHCRAVARREARNFYYGLRLLPEPQRSALYAIYAWMRRADDLADEPASAERARAALEGYRAATDDALAGTAPGGDAELLALASVARRFPLEAADFHAMLAGQLDDLDGRRYETFDDLRVYCERVASSVGLVCIRIWGYDDPAAPERAIERGIAFQLTNILRDFVEDHRRGRTYLPRREFEEAGLDPDGLLAWCDAERCGRFVLQQVERAEAYYRRSAPLEEMITPACRPTLRAMTGIYRELARKMRARPFRVVQGRRIRLAAPRKVAIALGARWGRTAPGRRGGR